MAGRLVPAFAGVPLYSKRLREASFWLLACGNVLRVLFQGLSAVSGPAMLRVAGVSGVLRARPTLATPAQTGVRI